VCDPISVGPLNPLQMLPGRNRKTFDIAALPFGKQSLECQTAFPRSADSGQNDKPIQRNVDVEVFQIVDSDTAQFHLTARVASL
jgi:hypothetical protein